MLERPVLEKQLTDILKRWISNVTTFEKVRENNTRKKNTGKKYENKNTGINYTGKKYGKNKIVKNTGKSAGTRK